MAGVSTKSGEQASDISSEEENYLRLAHLLIRVAPAAVRVIFDFKFYSKALKLHLNCVRSSILEPLKYRRVINQAQWDLLFPISGTPSSETFDLTLMICLIRNLTNIQIEDTLPFMGNDVDGAALSTIKYYRNKIMHSSDGILKDVLFNKWWDETSQAIIQLGGTSFTECCSLAKVRRLDRNDREILNEIRNMIGTFDPVPKGVRDICDRRILEWKKENVAQTRAIKRLTELVEQHNVALAVGPSGCGKSTAIHYIALQLAQTQEENIIIVDNLEEIKYFYHPDRKNIVVMENVFGDARFDKNKALKWLEMTKDIKVILDSNRVKLLASCKTRFFQHRISKTIKFFSKASCDFLARDYCLTDDERLDIANFYLTEDEIQLLKSSNVLSEFDFFPLLCKYYRRGYGGVVEFFADPTDAVCADLSRLELFDQTALATLFLFVVYNNSIPESIFTEEIKKILVNIADHFDLESNFSVQAVKNEMEKLNNSYIRKQNNKYSIHEKIFDIYVYFFGQHMFDLTVQVAHIHLIRDRFVFKRLFKEFYKKEIVVEIPLEKEQTYFDRLKKDIGCGVSKHVFGNRNLKDSSFRTEFITQVIVENDKIDSLSDKMLFSLLISILDKNFYDIVAILLTKGIPLNQRYWDGETPLFKAAKKGCSEIVQELLKQNADPNFHASLNWLDKLYPGLSVKSVFHNIDTSQYVIPFCRPSNLPMREVYSDPLNRYSPFANGGNYLHSVQSYLDDMSCNEQSKLNIPYIISPLHIAAQRGNTDIVKILLSHNALPDYDNECPQIASPLFTASSKGYTDIVQLLLENKSSSDVAVLKEKKTNLNEFSQLNLKRSLYVAVAKGYYEVVKLLVKYQMDIIKCNENLLLTTSNFRLNTQFVWNMVAIAFVKKHDKIVQLLLNNDCCSDFRYIEDVSILFQAICKGKHETVKLLLEHNFDPNICLNDGESPLNRAARLGYTEIVKELLEHKSNPNIFDSMGESPLYRASSEGHTEIVKLLLEHNSNPQTYKMNGALCLHAAVYQGRIEIVKLLLQHKIDINVCNVGHKSPLYIATENGQNETVALLLMYKCNPNICDDSNISPLLMATTKGNGELVKLLLEYKSDPNICDNMNISPLLMATMEGKSDLVKLLLEYKSDPNICDKNKESPLSVAAQRGYSIIVKLLLDNNCDINIRNRENKLPLIVAFEKCHTEIVQLLLNHE